MAADPTVPPVKRTRRGGGGITLGDVARLAGVSPITASRALNTPGQVAKETLERVREAVSQTGYVPNRLAGGLASAKSRLVAAVVPTISGPVFMEMVEALTAELALHGYQLMLGQSGYTQSREDALLDAIIGRRPDGIVLTGIVHSPEGRRRLLASNIPVVETWDLTPTPIDMLVGFSHVDAAAAVVRHLHGKGRRRLAILSGDDERAERRNRGFVAEAQRLGLVKDAADVPVLRVPAPTTLGSGRTALGELLTSAPKVDGVFCSSDLLALGVLTEAAARGIPVPERLSVVGFGDLAFAGDTHPALSTVRLDGTGIGQRAARFIVDRADDRPIGEKVVDLGFQVIERGSS